MPEEKIDKELQNKIQELQILEQNLQNLLMQKQAFQMELNETENAESELKKAKNDVFKITGQIMVKANKKELEKELSEKKKILDLRLKNIQKQEDQISSFAEKLRQEVTEKIKNK